ncbi:MAG: serine protease [Microcystis sp. LE19-84.1B]|nr:serine protease [Microcystis sp. LE19-84.1B]
MQAFLYPIEAQTSNADEQPSIGKMDEDMIRDIARLITVRVYTVLWEKWPFTTDDSGSGVIVDRQEIKRKNSQSIYNYLVLTNAHVLSRSGKFYIQTHEGFIHRGKIHPKAKFEQMGVKADLALLWFESPYQYETAIKKTSENLPDKSDFFVTGFPCKVGAVPSTDCPAEFLFTKGKGWVIDRYLKDGYQLAFTNDTEEGTSGGAILDHQGHLVGINGRGKTTADAPQNRYADDKKVPFIIQDNAPLSLGLPIDWYLSLNSQQLFRDLPTSTPQLEPIGFLSPPPSVKSETRGVSKLNPMTAVDRLTLEQKLNMILVLSGVLPLIVLILIILVVLTILKNRIENFWIYFHPIGIATFQIESNHKIKIFISNSEKVVDFTTNKPIKLPAAQNCQIILTSLSLGSHQNKNIIPKIVDNNQNYYRYGLEEGEKDQKVIYKILRRGKTLKLIHTRSKIETVTVKFEFQDNTGQ